MTYPTPTPEQREIVQSMVGCGFPEEQVAKVLRTSVETLHKYYPYELEVGHILANHQVARSLFEKATSDHPGAITAAIFWCKTKLGWKEPPVTIEQSLQILDKRASEMTNDELVSLIARATQHLEGQAPPQGELH